MKAVFKLAHFIKPYWKRATAALILLTSLVFMDLSLPRLIERIIDQGIMQKNLQVVIQTSDHVGDRSIEHPDCNREQQLVCARRWKCGTRYPRGALCKDTIFFIRQSRPAANWTAYGAVDQWFKCTSTTDSGILTDWNTGTAADGRQFDPDD